MLQRDSNGDCQDTAKLKAALDYAQEYTRKLRTAYEAQKLSPAATVTSNPQPEITKLETGTQTELCTSAPEPRNRDQSALPQTAPSGTCTPLARRTSQSSNAFLSPTLAAPGSSLTPLHAGISAAVQQACAALLTPNRPAPSPVPHPLPHSATHPAPAHVDAASGGAVTPTNHARQPAAAPLDPHLNSTSLHLGPPPTQPTPHPDPPRDDPQQQLHPPHQLNSTLNLRDVHMLSPGIDNLTPLPPASKQPGTNTPPSAPTSSATTQQQQYPPPAFSPQTAALRLRAAMQWMQLQLHATQQCGAPRQRRYSDSSVSPVMVILEAGTAANEPRVGGPDGGSGGEEHGAAAAVAAAAQLMNMAPLAAAAAGPQQQQPWGVGIEPTMGGDYDQRNSTIGEVHGAALMSAVGDDGVRDVDGGVLPQLQPVVMRQLVFTGLADSGESDEGEGVAAPGRRSGGGGCRVQGGRSTAGAAVMTAAAAASSRAGLAGVLGDVANRVNAVSRGGSSPQKPGRGVSLAHRAGDAGRKGGDVGGGKKR